MSLLRGLVRGARCRPGLGATRGRVRARPRQSAVTAVTRACSTASSASAAHTQDQPVPLVPTSLPPLRFLVVDGYAEEGREQLRDAGVTLGSELYERMLLRCSPKEATVDIVYPDDDDFDMDMDLSPYDGVAWNGSSLTIHTGEWSPEKQIEFRKRQFRHPVPSFGSCWAVQVAACAVGGRCAASPKGREHGISRKITLTPEGRAHPMFTGKPSTFDALTFHNDEVTHLGIATNLARNGWSEVQAIEVTPPDGGGVFWGVQYHPEYSLHDLACLIHSRTSKLVEAGYYEDEAAVDAYVADLKALHHDPSLKHVAHRLGVDADVMDEGVRWVEVRNWIRLMVVPYQLMRLAGSAR